MKRSVDSLHWGMCVFAAFIAALIIPALAIADVVPAKPSDIVALFHGSAPTTACPDTAEFNIRVGADLTQTPFAIPSGKVFVVTEVELNRHDLAGQPGVAENIIPFYQAQNPAFVVPVGKIPVVFDANGGAHVRVRISPVPMRGTLCAAFIGGGDSVTLHGFMHIDN